MNAVPLLMTVREAAQYLGRSEAFVRSLCHTGSIVCRRISGRYYIHRPVLDAWLAEPDVAVPVFVKTPHVMPMTIG